MAIQAGTKLGPYEIQGTLGAGGMGEVYRARDSKLERAVAIKVLGAAYSSDTERLHRFEHEARAASALNHPNIVTIHDIGRHDATSYLAMEYVDGRTLRELLDGGNLTLKKILSIGAQVADGLAKAHTAGIVHRDLKPENIMVTGDGLVKILDFGLAKLVTTVSEANGATATAVVPATHPGMVMGTVGYMSPEQARGAAVDFRSDQFSLGTVLYEMLTSKRPFQRESSAQTMTAIIEDDPVSITESNPKAPAPVRWIVERCLAKEPEERYASTRDLARDLQRVRDHLSEASTGSVLGIAAPPATTALRRYLPLAAIGALAVIAGLALGSFLFRTPAPEPAIVRTLTFSGRDLGPAASPDGRSVVFASDRDGKSRIWLKQLAGGGEVPLTEGPDDVPRFSPDGSMIVFARTTDSERWVCRAAVVGGEARKLARGDAPDWSPDGKEIAFRRGESVWLMSPDGSNARELRKMEYGIRDLRWSPDGKWLAIVMQVSGISAENITFRLLSRDGQQLVAVKPAFQGGDVSAVGWASNDEVLYVRSESVGSIGPLNTGVARLIRQKVPDGGGRVIVWLPGGSSAVDIVDRGRLVVDNVLSRENLREIALRRSGREAIPDKWLTRGSSIDRQPFYSPDGQWVLFTSNRSGNLDVWAISRGDGVLRRLTDDPGDDWDPSYTRDGKLLWTSHRSGNFEIWMAEADGTAAHQVSHDGVDAENPTSAKDGWVIYNSGNASHRGLWKVRADGSDAKLLVAGETSWPMVSPDGESVLATANNKYIGVYRVSDGKETFRIRLRGQGRAAWMPDGKAIAFTDEDAKGVLGIYQQDFSPGQDTAASRKPLVTDPDRPPESFGIAPDGGSLVYAVVDTSANLLTLDGVSGIGK